MYTILTLNNISPHGLARLPAGTFKVGADVKEPDGILVRSFKMHDMEIPDSLKAVGRAGAGVNNIPVDKLSKLGIPVFNAPGANANAVKELVLAGMLLACRHICRAWDFARGLQGSDAEISKAVEAGKKNFAGFELPGRMLGVIGLGAIGRNVANVGVAMGMKVVGFDPGLTVEGAWQLSADVKKATSVEELLRQVYSKLRWSQWAVKLAAPPRCQHRTAWFLRLTASVRERESDSAHLVRRQGTPYACS